MDKLTNGTGDFNKTFSNLTINLPVGTPVLGNIELALLAVDLGGLDTWEVHHGTHGFWGTMHEHA